jgi:hypothetical protein
MVIIRIEMISIVQDNNQLTHFFALCLPISATLSLVGPIRSPFPFKNPLQPRLLLMDVFYQRSPLSRRQQFPVCLEVATAIMGLINLIKSRPLSENRR